MLQPTDTLSVSLTAQSWNTLIQLLVKAPLPWEVSNPLIQEIQGQCMNQQRAVMAVQDRPLNGQSMGGPPVHDPPT
jgi:hypothetical protein